MHKRRSQSSMNSKEFPRSLIIIFILLALFSSLGLDYIYWKQSRTSFIFSKILKKEERLERPEFLNDILQNNLPFQAIAKETVHQYRDKENILHVKLELELKKYLELAPLLEGQFTDMGATVQKQKSIETEDKQYHMWTVEAEQALPLYLLFSCQKEIIVPPSEEIEETFAGKVALIVDDMGYSLDAISKLSSLDLPVTISILPYSPLAEETANIARSHGLEVILHLPLEPINGYNENNDTEGIILSDMDEIEVLEILEKNLGRIPNIQGVNNHMGSKVTSNSTVMPIILRSIKEKNLYFVDSRTTSQSVAFRIAQDMGIPSAYRDVFLDGELNEKYIKKQLIDLFQKAQRNGVAVGICHPSKETLNVLMNNFHLVKEFNLKAVFASEIVK